jgi:hypothetical protein
MGAVVGSPPINNQFTSFTKAVWFLLGQEGGRWTASEIMLKVQTSWTRDSAISYLSEMARSGLIRRFKDEDGRMRYGVTRTCKIPRNMTLAEIEQLVGIKFVEDACEPASIA